jgi:hypothetical protein
MMSCHLFDEEIESRPLGAAVTFNRTAFTTGIVIATDDQKMPVD